ncbi:MAG: stage V sporulation protein AD, partial [Bacillota bacterium]
IITGDLGKDGRKILLSLLKEKNINFPKKFFDCGAEIYKEKKKYGAGGSGCAASATLLGGYFIPALQKGDYKKILAIGTGALLSPISIMQGESIPGIAHAITLEKNEV